MNETVTLDNCADEPIHIPGSIQPHGGLLAFDLQGQLCVWSANAAQLIGRKLGQGLYLQDLGFSVEIAELIGEQLDAQAEEITPVQRRVPLGGRDYDLVVHRYLGRVIAEFEACTRSGEEVVLFSLRAHRAIEQLRHHKSIEALLNTAVREVAHISGFHRVMAYRFRADDSGEVAAEHCRSDLEPFLGRRYPASDIPAQARRLYQINTLRLIENVAAQSVPLLGAAGAGASLDLSHSVLRSVSPIHIEYLSNLGVQASMSISIVIEGRLWGMIACHHMEPLLVPYAVRMTCDVLAQLLAAAIQNLLAQERSALALAASTMRAALMKSVHEDADVLGGIVHHASALQVSLGADALIVAHYGKLFVHGEVDRELAARMIASLLPGAPRIEQRQQRGQWPEALREDIGIWVGLLGISFDPSAEGWIVALRKEQIETVRWGGRPEKQYAVGPLGPRLTPRGSFEEWRETVRDCAEGWPPSTIENAELLLRDLQGFCGSRHAENDRARAQLLAILGHDLRDPLQSISMAAQVLRRGGEQESLSRRILASSGRMQNLVSQVLDLSRLSAGIGIGIRAQRIDLSALVADMIDEARASNAAYSFDPQLETGVSAELDENRIAQAISNLISNARHHGQTGHPIRVRLARDTDGLVLEVANVAAPIEPALVAQLFKPFKHSSESVTRRSHGLGLGLYIANEIALAHGGTLHYRHEQPHVIFTLRLPA